MLWSFIKLSIDSFSDCITIGGECLGNSCLWLGLCFIHSCARLHFSDNQVLCEAWPVLCSLMDIPWPEKWSEKCTEHSTMNKAETYYRQLLPEHFSFEKRFWILIKLMLNIGLESKCYTFSNNKAFSKLLPNHVYEKGHSQWIESKSQIKEHGCFNCQKLNLAEKFELVGVWLRLYSRNVDTTCNWNFLSINFQPSPIYHLN